MAETSGPGQFHAWALRCFSYLEIHAGADCPTGETDLYK
ncbi:hypothetical protein PSYAC_00020 [Pseudomonas syringae pv. actinidiae str. M302091]|nr:hypothetical protein PSYAC_00020 [Pseudomonas syringae pv. actinidiae str. M302091]